MTVDLVVRGGTVVTVTGSRRADVAVADGRVAAVGRDLPGGRAELDARGLHVLPGLVDGHVHLNDPGRAEWEGVPTGSAALAAGGVTTYVDMPLNAHPPTVDGASFDAKLAATTGHARVDFALWGGLVPGPAEALEELAARGVVGFKAFMSASGVADFPAADDLTLLDGMRVAARLGLPVAVHAESDVLTAGLAARAVAAGTTTMRDYLASRPVVVELEAIGRALTLAREARCALHVVHVSTGRGVALVAAARAEGLDVSCETCPHYLVLDEEDAGRIGAPAKCAPPLRPAPEREALWAALRAGTLPMVASDHSPGPPELKSGDDLFAVWGGIAGAQTSLPLLLDEGHGRRGLTLATLVEVAARFPARRLALAGKGTVEVGADADLALVDLDVSWTLRTADLRQRHPVSPFVGRRLRGRVVRTVLRGRTVAVDGRPTGDPHGRLVRPARPAGPAD